MEKRIDEKIGGRLLFQPESKPTITNHKEYHKYITKPNTQYKIPPYKTDSPVSVFISKKKTTLILQKKSL